MVDPAFSTVAAPVLPVVSLSVDASAPSSADTGADGNKITSFQASASP